MRERKEDAARFALFSFSRTNELRPLLFSPSSFIFFYVPASNDKAAGHKPDKPAEEVVTTADSTVAPTPAAVNPVPTPRPRSRPQVDFAFLREQVSLEQVLRHLGWLDHLRGRGQQRRGPYPVHGQPTDREPTFSVHLSRNLFQCFQAECGAHGNVLDLWAAVRKLPLREAALDLADTFQLQRTREEEPVRGTRGAGPGSTAATPNQQATDEEVT